MKQHLMLFSHYYTHYSHYYAHYFQCLGRMKRQHTDCCSMYNSSMCNSKLTDRQERSYCCWLPTFCAILKPLFSLCFNYADYFSIISKLQTVFRVSIHFINLPPWREQKQHIINHRPRPECLSNVRARSCTVNPPMDKRS